MIIQKPTITNLEGIVATGFMKIAATTGAITVDTNTYLTTLAGAVLTDQTSGQTIGDTTNRLTKLWATDITVSNAITGSVTGNAGTVTNGIYTTSQVTALATVTNAGDKGKYLYNNASTGALEWQTVSGSGANTALDNLASVAINTSLISDADSTDDLGSTSKQWANVHVDRILSTIANLTIENDLSDGDIIFKVNDGGVDTTLMTLDGSASGVGIGTATPATRLNVDGIIRSDRASVPTQYVELSGGDADGFYLTGTPIAGTEKRLRIQNFSGVAVPTDADRIDLEVGLLATPSIKMTATPTGVGFGTVTPRAAVEAWGDFTSVLLDNGNVILRKVDYSGGGWARTLLNFQEYDTTSLFQIGGLGSDNTFTYGYIGSAYNNTTIKWYPNKNVDIGGTLALGANNLTMTGSIADTTNRVTKGWFTDLECTNAIAGSVTGNAGTVTTAAETGDTSCSIAFVTATDGSLPLKTNTNLTFNASTGVLTSASAVLTTADINGGTLDGATIGASTPSTIVGTTITANTGIVLPSGSGIKLTLPATDAYVTGPFTDSFNAGYTTAIGDLVFFGSGGKWLEVDADAVATCAGLMGIAMEVKNDGDACKVALPGSMVRVDAWNWTVGNTLYAGETLGAMQNTIPTGPDAIIKVVGFAVSADVIYFNPSPDQQSTVA